MEDRSAPKPLKLKESSEQRGTEGKRLLTSNSGGDGLTAYQRHVRYVQNYMRFYGSDKSRLQPPVLQAGLTDYDILHREHRFIRNEEDEDESNWDKRLAKKYYDKLFKEYCIADLSRFQSGQIGLRWRTEKEVFDGKGQFVCASKHCAQIDGLTSYEINFGYMEDGQKKNALVKIRLCDQCLEKANYKRQKRLEKAKAKEVKKLKKQRRDLSEVEAGPLLDEDEIQVKEEENGDGAPTRREKQMQNGHESEAVAKEEEIWSKKPDLDRTLEDDFDDYFNELFP